MLPGEHFSELTRKLRGKTRQFYNQRRLSKDFPSFSNSRILTQSHFIHEYELYMKAEPDSVNSYSRSLKSAWCALSAYFMLSFISTVKEKKENTRREQRAGRKKKTTEGKLRSSLISWELIPWRQQQPVSLAPGIHYNTKLNKGNL